MKTFFSNGATDRVEFFGGSSIVFHQKRTATNQLFRLSLKNVQCYAKKNIFTFLHFEFDFHIEFDRIR